MKTPSHGKNNIIKNSHPLFPTPINRGHRWSIFQSPWSKKMASKTLMILSVSLMVLLFMASAEAKRELGEVLPQGRGGYNGPGEAAETQGRSGYNSEEHSATTQGRGGYN
ncbi:hypothetical protein AMTRI_Chr09g22090 [Amborella trichopoda]